MKINLIGGVGGREQKHKRVEPHNSEQKHFSEAAKIAEKEGDLRIE